MSSRYEFFEKLLVDLEALQTGINNIRETLKREIRKVAASAS